MTSALAQLPAQFAQAIKLIDHAHAQDPREAKNTGKDKVPHELHYARQMTSWLAIRCPEASPILQVACRAQHFQRWEIPRDSFPRTRPGYLTWRAKQKAQAASQVADLLGAPEIQPEIAEQDRARIAALIRKEKLDSDPEAQALEDVACLVFLDDQFDDFEKRDDVDEEKIVNILRKTWGKMSPQGREIALEMKLSDRAKTLIGKALASADAS
ncbi:glutamyl-tRNA synthetase [Beauveria bassiana ARSEF 2860]|uniref:Glutamyl-tRNA synthetase n=1 Tax=Beauveria bassiana (strain ARSEF 2860) TaxID=655819 RepID=J5JD39_BEAB2|nr:glutamyl-tRNA synthetase [Beauveria bassiana ARSEF 2860]EJP63883.1 glutamyl-tRNA synthetase [Beauveria bassiana ARSEF 2860]